MSNVLLLLLANEHKFKFNFKVIYSHLFNNNKTKIRREKEVKTELTIHWIKHKTKEKSV